MCGQTLYRHRLHPVIRNLLRAEQVLCSGCSRGAWTLSRLLFVRPVERRRTVHSHSRHTELELAARHCAERLQVASRVFLTAALCSRHLRAGVLQMRKLKRRLSDTQRSRGACGPEEAVWLSGGQYRPSLSSRGVSLSSPAPHSGFYHVCSLKCGRACFACLAEQRETH